MHVEAPEAAVGEGLGHQHGRMAVAAADVGDLGARLELGRHAGQRGQPLLDEARAVGVAVERGDAAEQPLVVLAPAHAPAGLEGGERLRLVGPHGGDDLPGVRQEHGARVVGEDRGLLRRQLVGRPRLGDSRHSRPRPAS